MWPPRTILHPTDFSEQALYALGLAGLLARHHGARLFLLHVASPFRPAGMMPPGRHPKSYFVALRKSLRGLLPLDGRVESKVRTAEGEPAAEILRIAREIGCDLIVMGTHGRTGLKHLLTGSVAEEVLRQAPCPILTVKPPIEEPRWSRRSRWAHRQPIQKNLSVFNLPRRGYDYGLDRDGSRRRLAMRQR